MLLHQDMLEYEAKGDMFVHVQNVFAISVCVSMRREKYEVVYAQVCVGVLECVNICA